MDSGYVHYEANGADRTENWILRPFLFLFLCFVLLPYVKVIPTETDTQPNAIIMAGLLLVMSFRGQRLPKAIFWLWLLPPIAMVIFVIDVLRMSDVINSGRSLYNYFALPIITTAVGIEWRSIRRFLFPMMNAINLVYFLVAVAQFLGDEQYVGGIVGGGFRVDHYDFVYRGAVGLAPEPTAYATVMFLFLVVYSLLGKEQSWWAALSFLQILFFSRSTTIIFITVAVLGVRALVGRHFKTFLVGVLCVSVLGLAIFSLQHFADSRVHSLTVKLVNDPASILDSDYSVLSRVGHAWYGCLGIFRNYGAPNGFNTFVDYYNDKIESVDWLRPRVKAGISAAPGNRIMSGLGAVFFELGLVGLIVPLTLWKLVRRRFGTVFSPGSVTALLGFGLVALHSGVPIGFPLLALVLGVLAGTGVEAGRRPLSRHGSPMTIGARNSSVPVPVS